MKLTPYAAFGYSLVEMSLVDGETYQAEVSENLGTVHLWVRGGFKNKNLTTGEPWEDFPVGTFLTPESYVAGTFEHTAIGDTSLFCYNSARNRDYVPPISKFHLVAGESTVLPQGTKLFLCSGSVTINGNQISKPTQIRGIHSPLSIHAETDCYGLLFV